MSTIQPLKGTRDFYPEEMTVRTWFYDTVRKISESFGYLEYEGPYLETLGLYAAKSGEELVKEQSFVFEDRGGNMITLRPELTPTLARMVAQRQPQLLFPLRWWSWGPFWRYERPQKGRSREFLQWNIDLIGVDSPEADAELVAIACTFLQTVGLTPDKVRILVNNRRLMDAQLRKLDIPAELRPQVFRLIDRQDKLSPKDWEAYAVEIGLSPRQFEGIREILTNKDLWKESEEMQRFFQAIDAFGVREYTEFAPHIIRGLEYYTGTVFEAWDNDGEFRAILGGGRYDSLVQDVGGEQVTAVGFAMGDVVMTLVLQKFDCLPRELGLSPAPVMVTVFDEDLLTASFALAAQLRKSGIKTACYPEPAKLGKQFKYADRMGMRVAAILGPEEAAQGKIAIKDLKTGEQATLPQDQAAEHIRQILAHKPSS